MFEVVLGEHLKYIAAHYGDIEAGTYLSPPLQRNASEEAVFQQLRSLPPLLSAELSPHLKDVVHIRNGSPKGAWPFVYYLSFHRADSSTGPQNGIYPVFLFSEDQKRCYLALVIAAATVGITPRSGWTRKKGNQLEARAQSILTNISLTSGWIAGPIKLGKDNQPLKSGGVGKGYEQGVIAYYPVDPVNPPSQLSKRLDEGFSFLDAALDGENRYLETLIPDESEDEERDQLHAAILGENAEQYFCTWIESSHPEWGRPKIQTDRVGLGYDMHFPEVGYYVEIKASQDDSGSIRLTPKEMKAAEKHGDHFFLALVIGKMDSPTRIVRLLQDPQDKLQRHAVPRRRLQIFYTATLRNILNK